jgi:hypothetical protein
MDFLVSKDDLRECRIAESEPAELADGEVRLAVSSFGLSSNNVTYGVFGAAMNYWNFFPAEDGWGRIPVWGFADVAESKAEGVDEGSRVYGYLPPSSELIVVARHADERGFNDGSEHRASLPSAYNRYLRTDADPFYDAGYEEVQMLLRPLFFTSFLLDDLLADSADFGAKYAVVSSASSKTSLAAAFLIAKRGGVELVGLTSDRNARWVEGLDVYDSVVPYKEIGNLPVERSVYLDMSGDAAVRRAVHTHYGDELAHDAAVGVTHWEETQGSGDMPGPDPTFFFAPDRVTKRSDDWGREELERRVAEAWQPFAEWTAGWMKVERGSGGEAIESTYREVLEGNFDPAVGYVLSP